MRASQLPTGRRADDAAGRTTRQRAPAPLVLGRYRLHRRLGAGGFGTVWHAHDERLSRDVAVKILPRERVLGGRFEREALATARLTHPGIVTLYEALVDDDDAYLVSELVRGPTLDQLLEAGRLSDRDIVTIGIALCDALAHAHGQGVVHRDVKPSNILVPARPASSAELAKLTDFGVARVIGGDSLTRTGEIIGTAAYMAPEQAEGREAGASADLYSLALVIYEALTGVNPVRTNTAAQRARRLGAHLPPLRRQRRDLPRELGAGIDLALRPRPRERGTLERLRAALEVAAEKVRDEPGVVTGPWPTGATFAPDAPRALEAPPPAAVREQASEPERGVHWPARALAGVGAAVPAAWLAAHTGFSPLSPAATAALACLLVAALPRIGWVSLAAATAVSLAIQGKAGGALVILLAAAIPVLLMPRSALKWPLAVAAPVLGAINLAGAWPALAATSRAAWQRAALGITGWLWLLLAAPIANADLYARRAPGAPAADTWMRSLSATVDHVLGPIAGSGALAVGLLWAAAAVVLPLIRTGRSLPLDLVIVTVWSALTVSTAAALLGVAHGLTPGSAPLGAVLGGTVALLPTAHTQWRVSRRERRGGVPDPHE